MVPACQINMTFSSFSCCSAESLKLHFHSRFPLYLTVSYMLIGKSLILWNISSYKKWNRLFWKMEFLTVIFNGLKIGKIFKSNTWLLILDSQVARRTSGESSRYQTGSSIKSQVLDFKTLPIFRSTENKCKGGTLLYFTCSQTKDGVYCSIYLFSSHGIT